MTVVLKVGGSVITKKGERETLDDPALDRVARAVADARADLVVVHGGGSFGHPPADGYDLSPTSGTHDAAAALEVHDAMGLLSDAVVSRLQDRGSPALPVHPLSAGFRDAAGALDLAVGPVEAMLSEGFVPVLHGDVLVHADRGVTIVSGDELVSALAVSLDADRVGLCTAAPGVLDAEGTVIDRIEAIEEVADVLERTDATDVTGGMAGKVETLIALGVPARIFGLDGLADFLGGGSPGTLVRGRPRP